MEFVAKKKERKPWHFKPGNPGKPMGARHKFTVEQEERLKMVFETIQEDLIESIRNLSHRDRVRMFIDLLEFTLPKLARVEMKSEHMEQKIEKILIEIVNPGEKPKMIEQ
jgi:hypothetical protein